MGNIEHCDCGMPHLGGTEHADECPAGVYVPGHGLTGDAGEVERLRHQLAGAVAAERERWLRWASRRTCCEAGLIAAPDPCLWHDPPPPGGSRNLQ